MGPMVMAMQFREVFGGTGANPPDLQALADQHAHKALLGLLMPTTAEPDGRRTNRSRPVFDEIARASGAIQKFA